MTKTQMLEEVMQETKRFTKKLQLAISESKTQPDVIYSKRFAAAKRAAYDLKNELTRITNFNRFKYADSKER